MEVISDKALLVKVNQRLARMGSGQGTITATARGGEITLTGTLKYAIQRQPLIKAAGSVMGVRRVVDQLQIPKKKAGY